MTFRLPKPSRELQITVGAISIGAASGVAHAMPDSYLKWILVGVLVVGGGLIEWMIERAYRNIKNRNN